MTPVTVWWKTVYTAQLQNVFDSSTERENLTWPEDNEVGFIF